MPETSKRKRPPTYQHYPPSRAKTLRKAWVDTAKIRTKWKAQKRKDGLASARTALQSHERQGDEDGKNEEETGNAHTDSQQLDTESDSENDPERITETGGDTTYTPPPQQHPFRRKQNHIDRGKQKHIDNHHKYPNKTGSVDKDSQQPSLRELFHEAYAESSLHTYKSDPLKRRRDGHSTTRRGSSRGGTLARGRGQPNMKLRMNAMLEKIKRDYT